MCPSCDGNAHETLTSPRRCQEPLFECPFIPLHGLSSHWVAILRRLRKRVKGKTLDLSRKSDPAVGEVRAGYHRRLRTSLRNQLTRCANATLLRWLVGLPGLGKPPLDLLHSRFIGRVGRQELRWARLCLRSFRHPGPEFLRRDGERGGCGSTPRSASRPSAPRARPRVGFAPTRRGMDPP